MANLKPSHRAWLLAAVVLFPVSVGWAYKVFFAPRPYWAWYYDPEVVYYYDSLRILAGEVPTNVDHPATPVQVVGAAIALGTGRDPLSIDRFRVVAYSFLLVMDLAAVALLAATLFGDLPAGWAIAGLSMFFLAPTALQWNAVWIADAFYLAAGALLLAAGWRFFSLQWSLRRAMLFGATLGLALSVQFLFLAWVPGFALSVLGDSRVSVRRRTGAGIAAALALAVVFIAATAVAASRYRFMLGWIWRLGTHGGPYGSGGKELLSFSAIAAGALNWLQSAKVWFAGGLASLAALCWGLLERRRRGMPVSPEVFCLSVFGIVSLLASSLFGFKAAESLRYLLPAGVLSILFVALAVRVRPGGIHAGFGWAGAALALVFVVKHVASDISWHSERTAAAMSERAQLSSLMARSGVNPSRSVVVYGWRLSQPSLGLRMVTTDPALLSRIESVYPNEGHYNPWNRKIYLPAGAAAWDYLVVSEEDLASFPEPIGAVLGSVASYRLVASARMLPPNRSVAP